MAIPTCSRCKRAILSDDVNVAKDVAYCRTCNLSYPLSALTHGEDFGPEMDLSHPPAGTWCRRGGTTTEIGATHRSLGMAFGALLFTLFWNGIVSVFVLLAISATLANLKIPVPSWFPAPKMNGGAMTVGMTLFLWLFLTPFIAIGLAMFGAFLSALAGRTEVRISRGEGVIFVGIGPLGYRRRFAVSAVQEVRIEDQRWRDSDGHSQRKANIIVELQQGKKIKFASMLTEERRKFVAAAVRRSLLA